MGGKRVVVYSGATGAQVDSFAPFETAPGAAANARRLPFTGGVRVAVADVNGDGAADIITAMGRYGSRIKIYGGDPILTGENRAILHDFLAGGRNGVFVGAGDTTGDGKADLIVGSGLGDAQRVRVFDGIPGREIRTIIPLGESGFGGGIRVAAADVNVDGIADIVVGVGSRGGSQVRAFDGASGSELLSLAAFPTHASVGLFVAGSSPVPALRPGPMLPPA